MGKNRNKNNQSRPKPISTPVKKGITEIQKQEIEQLKAAVDEKYEMEGTAQESQLTAAEESMVEEAGKNEDVQKYLRYLTDVNKRLNTLLDNATKKKTDLDEREDKLKRDKKEFEEEEKKRKAELDQQEKEFKESTKERIENLNKKEKEVLKRELQLDNGEYTGTIRSLLDKLTAAEQEICAGTTAMIDHLARKNAEYQEKSIAFAIEKEELEQKKNELESERSDFRREKKKAEITQKLEKERFEKDVRDQYKDQLAEAQSEVKRLKFQNESLQTSNESLTQLRERIMAVFGDTAPEDMLKEIQMLRVERDGLKADLDSRPTMKDLEEKDKHIAEITAAYEDIRSKLDEEALLLLKKRLALSDNYIVEIQGYEHELKSAKSREGSLKRTIEDLQITVDQLKGERQKDEEAFEFARSYDDDEELQTVIRRDFPKSLTDFAYYIQAKLASKEENPLYYDIDTIKTFIAGLFMSNISILQGISGTGKTSLPREFAVAMTAGDYSYVGEGDDKSPKAPYRICAVQSGWRDRMDLMGFYNSFEHKYRETEFFKALYVANTPKYQNTLFLIILDEMNLSRPEHYFADFLSLLEQDEEQRYIDVDGNEQVWPKLVSENKGKLKVPKNVRFIGTANHDETTLSFAPKTYDRSNLMEMPKNYTYVDAKPDKDYSVSYAWLESEFKKALDKYVPYYAIFKKFLDSKEIHDMLAEKGLGTGNRFEKQAQRFISMYIACGETGHEAESLAYAADHLISSRLLRTIGDNYDLTKGSLQTFRDDFCLAFEETFDIQPPKISKLLDDIIATK